MVQRALLAAAILWSVPQAAVQAAPAAVPVASAMPATYAGLTALFRDWRAFAVPRDTAGQPDYSAASIARQQAQLPAWKARLTAIDTRGWPVSAHIDKQLVEAEMNGLDFNLRVLKPWARDPGFYADDRRRLERCAGA